MHRRQQSARRLVRLGIRRIAARRLQLEHNNRRNATADAHTNAVQSRAHTSVLNGELRPHGTNPSGLQCHERISRVPALGIRGRRNGLCFHTALESVVGNPTNGECVLAARLGSAAAVSGPERRVLSELFGNEPAEDWRGRARGALYNGRTALFHTPTSAA